MVEAAILGGPLVRRETIALFKKYAILHSSLLPYFATYAEQAHRTGVPIMRHTVLEYPGDPRSATAEYQYLLGEDLLVAPVIEPGATARKLYLPRGEWLNYWTGERYTGAVDVTVPAPIDQIPLLVRSGAIIPFKPEDEVASLKWNDPNLLSRIAGMEDLPAGNGRQNRHLYVAGWYPGAGPPQPWNITDRWHFARDPALRGNCLDEISTAGCAAGFQAAGGLALRHSYPSASRRVCGKSVSPGTKRRHFLKGRFLPRKRFIRR